MDEKTIVKATAVADQLHQHIKAIVGLDDVVMEAMQDHEIPHFMFRWNCAVYHGTGAMCIPIRDLVMMTGNASRIQLPGLDVDRVHMYSIMTMNNFVKDTICDPVINFAKEIRQEEERQQRGEDSE